MNLPGFPVYRPRRLRQSAALRRLVCETRLSAEQLVLPLFARAGRKLRRPIEAMPGVCQFSPDEILREAAAAARARRSRRPAVRHSRQKGREGFRRLREEWHRPADDAAVEKGTAVAAGHHGRVPVRIHGARPLRHCQ